MRQLFLVFALIAFGCTMSIAQQQAGQDSATPKTNSATVSSKTPTDFDQIQALIATPSLNQSQDANQKTTQPQPVIWQNAVFVVRDGAVYQPLLNGTVLVGIPGGGASGCFSLDLPQRIAALNEYLRKLQAAKSKE